MVLIFSCKFDNISLVLNKIINKINIQSLEKTDLAFMQTPNEIGIWKKNLEIIDVLTNDKTKKKTNRFTCRKFIWNI